MPAFSLKKKKRQREQQAGATESSTAHRDLPSTEAKVCGMRVSGGEVG